MASVMPYVAEKLNGATKLKIPRGIRCAKAETARKASATQAEVHGPAKRRARR